jgi:hypothetical protein
MRLGSLSTSLPFFTCGVFFFFLKGNKCRNYYQFTFLSLQLPSPSVRRRHTCKPKDSYLQVCMMEIRSLFFCCPATSFFFFFGKEGGVSEGDGREVGEFFIRLLRKHEYCRALDTKRKERNRGHTRKKKRATHTRWPLRMYVGAWEVSSLFFFQRDVRPFVSILPKGGSVRGGGGRILSNDSCHACSCGVRVRMCVCVLKGRKQRGY